MTVRFRFTLGNNGKGNHFLPTTEKRFSRTVITRLAVLQCSNATILPYSIPPSCLIGDDGGQRETYVELLDGLNEVAESFPEYETQIEES